LPIATKTIHYYYLERGQTSGTIKYVAKD
jgi:hypothetical protein